MIRRIQAGCLIFSLCFFAIFSEAAERDVQAEKSGGTDRFNFRIAPLNLLVSSVNVDLGYRVSEHFVVGPQLGIINFNFFDASVKGSSVGLTGQYYFDPAFTDSWYLALGLNTGSFEITSKNSAGTKATAKVSGTTLQYGGGYHWFWPSSFNLSLGLHLGSSNVSKVEINYSDGTKEDVSVPGASLGLGFMIGWTF